MMAVYNTPHEAFFVALFLTCRWICEILIASKPKRTKTPFTICMSAHPLPIGAFGMGIDVTKITLFTLRTALFGRKSMILRTNLTLLNINMSKNSTFAWFFLPKSLYYQWLFVSLQRQSSPSLLTMLKSCEAFFVYTHLNMANLIPFTKRFESSENLVNLLESRGLQICDRNKAIQYLDYIGYYRLSALLLLLEKPVVIIQEYKTSKMPFSQQFPLVPQENG